MAVETVCRILQQDPEVRRMLSPPSVCKRTDHASPAEFSRMQLIGGVNLDQVVPELTQRIATCVVEKPPYRYQWLARTRASKDVLVRVMTDAHVSAETALRCGDGQVLTDHEKADVLAFRGLLAHGILVHCLKKRFRVDYGIKTDAKKRMAVPYRASDTPSERSEFSQPDCAIMLTYLSYYYDGLTAEQVHNKPYCLCCSLNASFVSEQSIMSIRRYQRRHTDERLM
jgi:hypothetical protein